MADWTTEQTAKYVSLYNELRELHPDTDPRSPVFIEAIETECDFFKALDRLVRKSREAKTFHAAIDKLVEELTARRESAERDAVEWEERIDAVLCHIEDGTDESPVFVRPGYVLTQKDGGGFELNVLHDDPFTKGVGDNSKGRLEELFLERITVKAGIDHLKAEGAAIKAQADQAATRLARINEEMAELAEPILKPTESSVRLPIGTITLKKAKRRVRIKDRDVIADKYRIYPPPPDWVPNEPLLERDLLLGEKVLGAELDNGGPPTVSCRVK